MKLPVSFSFCQVASFGRLFFSTNADVTADRTLRTRVLKSSKVTECVIDL